jgi:hypothetical protein
VQLLAQFLVDGLGVAHRISLMNKKTSKADKPVPEYPLQTHGSRVAARGRRKANKMTEAQREEYFRRGVVLIHGG